MSDAGGRAPTSGPGGRGDASSTGGIVGVGVDLCSQERLAAAFARVPRLRARLLTPAERELPLASQAARVAVKEAVAKALGDSTMSWQDCWVERVRGRAPQLATTGTVARRAAELGVARFHLSMSHDAGLAIAVVVAER